MINSYRSWWDGNYFTFSLLILRNSDVQCIIIIHDNFINLKCTKSKVQLFLIFMCPSLYYNYAYQFFRNNLYKMNIYYKNGSILISRAAQGMFRSNFVITSGWSTPNRPMLWPRAITSAHRPAKNVESES